MARKNKPMTVGQLINELTQYDHDLPVELSSDAEGNSYSYVWSVADGESDITGKRCITIIPE